MRLVDLKPIMLVAVLVFLAANSPVFPAEGAKEKQDRVTQFFPFAYAWTPNIQQKLDELGYSSYKNVLVGLNMAKDPPYPADVEERVKKLGGGPGVLWLNVRWPAEDAESHRAKAVEVIRRLAGVAEKGGLRLAIYPHTGDTIQTARDALPLVKEAAHKNVGLTLNLAHELRQGNVDSLPKIIDEVKEHLFVVTINGADRPPPRPSGWGWDRLIKPLGEGDFDVYAFLKSLRQAGYEGPVGLQCFGVKKPTLEHLGESMRVWQEYTARLAVDK